MSDKEKEPKYSEEDIRAMIHNENISLHDRVEFIFREIQTRDRIKTMSKFIGDWLDSNGKWFNTENGLCYLSSEDLTIYPVNIKQLGASRPTQEFLSFLNRKTSLQLGMGNVFTATFQDVLASHDQLQPTHLHTYSYFDEKLSRIYLYDNLGKMLVITRDDMFVESNGYDGVYFQQGEYTPIDLDKLLGELQNVDGETLDRLLVNKINFSNSQLTIKQQKNVFKAWIHSLFFGPIMTTRPIVVFSGQSGSGKTYALKAVGNILMGSSFSESPLPKDERDFFAMLSESRLIQIDNLDTYQAKWFEDILATITTGASIKMRELYTSKKMLTIKPDTFVCVSTREAKFTRDDIADRTILFKLDRLGQFDGEFLREIEANRYLLLAEILFGVQTIMGEFKTAKNEKYNIRLIEFAKFLSVCIKLFEGVTSDLDIQEYLKRLTQSQNEFSLQNDPISTYIDFMLGEKSIVRLTTAELYKEIKRIAVKEFDSQFPYSSPISFGRAFKSKIRNLKDIFDIEEGMTDGLKKYRIAKKGVQDTDNSNLIDKVLGNE